jgi:carboxymethylenebutenolidase
VGVTNASVSRHALPVEGGALPLSVARGAGTGAALVVVPSAFGVGPDLEAQMRELAAYARLVVAFDPFFRGDGGLAPYDAMPRVMARLGALDRERCAGDFAAAIAWARRETGGAPVVGLGICFGGPFALEAAADGALAGVVTWHGTGMQHHLARAAAMRCPMHHHFGSADPFVPPAAVEQVRSAFAGRADVRVFVHEGATHGFSHRAAKQAYHAEAERAGMESVRELVAGELSAPGTLVTCRAGSQGLRRPHSAPAPRSG